MKITLAALWTLAGVSLALGAVTNTPDELQGAGDFNGDGRPDAVIVDKPTGLYRVGYNQADGSFTWTESRASGVEQATGLTVGRVLNTGRDALALTAPGANRVNVLDAFNPSVASVPVNVFPTSVGPNLVVALDIKSGGGNTSHDDLFVTSLANDPPQANQSSFIRSFGNSFSNMIDVPLTARAVAADRVQLKVTDPEVAGLLLDAAPDRTLVGISVTGAPSIVAAAGGLPAVDAFVHGRFASGSALSQFLLYRLGDSNLVLCPVLEPAPGSFAFGAGDVFAFQASLWSVALVPGPSDTRLLMIFNEGQTAGVYTFDGTNAPILVESFSAPEGEGFTGAVGLGQGNFSLFTGAGGHSEHFQRWNRTGNGYEAGAVGDLPGLNPLGTSGNVFFFKKQPFLNLSPGLVATLNAADWSSGLNLSDPSNVKVNAEKYVDAAQGLANPTLRQLGLAPSGGAFGLANQIQESFSLLSFRAAVGKEVAEVTIAPAPGHYPQGLSVSFASPELTAEIFYRLDETQVWIPYAGPFPLYRNTTVAYYAKLPGSVAKSVIHTASYQFDSAVDDVDTDGDGVPDYVELGYDWDHDGIADHEAAMQGLDTLHGKKDSDGDGHSDLAEILAGTNMYDPASKPSNQDRPDEQAAFDWYVLPRSLPGFEPGWAACATGTVVSAFDLDGGLLHATSSQLFQDLGFAGFPNLFADISQGFYIAATEPHFDVRTNGLPWSAGADTRIGRELLRLLPVPELSSGLTVNYVFGGGDLLTEAANWVTAVRAAQDAVEHPFEVSNMTYHDTLVALLCEEKLARLFRQREVLAPDDQMTLFPFRPQDAGRVHLSRAEVLSLETNLVAPGSHLPDPAFPGHKLDALYQSISQSVTNPPSINIQTLNALAADVYRLSAASNNVAPGVYPSPVDTLRDFVETGELQSNYLASLTWNPQDLAAALGGVEEILGGVPSRPIDRLQLRVREDSYASSDCVILETLTGSPRRLVLADGSPFKFPLAFQLLPGSLVEVFAYTDLPPACGAATLEVITLDVTAFPAVSSTDADGDLLSDDWECLFLATNPYGDDDGDGVNNLQEFFDGTDPKNALSHGAAAVDLQPPQIHIGTDAKGQLSLSWTWPEAYGGWVQFHLLATDALGQSFVEAPGVVQGLGGGQFQLVPESNGAGARFYQLQISLASAGPAEQ